MHLLKSRAQARTRAIPEALCPMAPVFSGKQGKNPQELASLFADSTMYKHLYVVYYQLFEQDDGGENAQKNQGEGINYLVTGRAHPETNLEVHVGRGIPCNYFAPAQPNSLQNEANILRQALQGGSGAQQFWSRYWGLLCAPSPVPKQLHCLDGSRAKNNPPFAKCKRRAVCN